MPEPFVSVEDLSDHLGRDVSAEDGASLAVEGACDVVRLETGQTFNLVTDDTILLDGDGTDAIMLPELPVVSIAEILLEDEVVSDYVCHDSGVVARTEGVWTVGRGNIEVTYDHGYSEVPRAVWAVALNLATRFFTRPEGAVFEALGARQVRYDTPAPGELTKGEKAILRKAGVYKQPWSTLVAS